MKTLPLILVLLIAPAPLSAADDPEAREHIGTPTTLPMDVIVDCLETAGFPIAPDPERPGQWNLTAEGDACRTVFTGFRFFRTREDMEKHMMAISLASLRHPKHNVAMFMPGARGTGKDLTECEPYREPDYEALAAAFNACEVPAAAQE